MATSIRLDPATEQRLDRLAAQTGRSKAYYLRELVQRGLEDLEDYYLASATILDGVSLKTGVPAFRIEHRFS